MSTEPKDLLHVCMKDLGPNPPTIKEFSAAFCSRCLQKECSRSIAGQSLFEARVANWEERLFKNPEKLTQADPRYAHIAAQKFVEYQPGGSLPIIGHTPAPASGWVDPRDLSDEVKSPTPPKKVEAKPEPSPEPLESEKVEEPSPDPTPIKEAPAAPAEKKPQAQPQLPVNTPSKSGIMLGEAPQQGPQKDAWDAPVTPPVEQGTTILKPGAKFRFGE